MGRRRFAVLLRGLSKNSVWRHMLATTPVVVEGEAAAALLNKL